MSMNSLLRDLRRQIFRSDAHASSSTLRFGTQTFLVSHQSKKARRFEEGYTAARRNARRNMASDQRGMTLVELTVSIVIMMTVASGVVIFMIDGIRNYSTVSAKANLLAQAQTAMDKVSADIMLAANADANNRIDDANSPISGDPNSWTSDTDTLVLATAVEDSSGNILYADPVEYVSHKNNVIYYLNGTTLYRRVLAASAAGNKARTTCPSALATTSCPADTVIMDDVESLVFSYRNHLNQTVDPDEARSVEVTVTAQDKAYDAARVNYTIRTVFRNK